MRPDIPKIKKDFNGKTCNCCGRVLDSSNYCKTKNWIFADGYLPICNDCIEEKLRDDDFSWEAVDKMCQYADIPFVPKEFERLHDMNGEKVFPVYAKVFESAEYLNLDWKTYYDEFKRLKNSGEIEEELPEIREARRKKMVEKWGAYSDEEIFYLENLFNGMMTTQNVNGALQVDQAIKICKVSLAIDNAIANGESFDKLLVGYDKIVKTAEFTPKNVKDINDFDTMGELVKWLEKKGWKNTFYDNVTRDVVDETIKNIQSYNQRLYTNESGIGDEITRRIEALKSTQEIENHYDVVSDYDMDEYESDGYASLMKEQDEFDPEMED